MDDYVSAELANARYIDPRFPIDDIDASLPKGWRWSYDVEGRPLYIYNDATQSSEWQSTVHPAYFPLHRDRLPPGWDRRLDDWGLVFYVDHHTATAQREHPTNDNVTDLLTGLPKGWVKMLDQNGVTYYLEENSLLATYDGGVMKSPDEDKAFRLTSRPDNGEALRRVDMNPTAAREARSETA